MRDIALPRTDAGVAVQLVVAVLIFGLALWRVRHDRDVRVLVLGVATITFAYFGLRALH